MKIKTVDKQTKYAYIETDSALIPYDNRTHIFKYEKNDSFEACPLREKLNWDKIIFYTKIVLNHINFEENMKYDYKDLFRIKIFCNKFTITLYFKNKIWHDEIFNTLKEKMKKQENINLDGFN